MDGQIKWKTDQQPAFVRGGSILADGLLLMTDGNTKLYLVEPSPAGFKPLASAVILAPGRQLGAAGAGGRQAARSRTEGAEGAPSGEVSGTISMRAQTSIFTLLLAPSRAADATRRTAASAATAITEELL
jgi:hypothetical protein